MAIVDDSKDSGSDGSWFLEAVGAIPPSPTPSETIAALELDNTLTHSRVGPSPETSHGYTKYLDGDTGTSNEAFTPVMDIAVNKPETTAEMDFLVLDDSFSATDDATGSTVIRPHRRLRAVSLGFLALLIAIAAVTSVIVPPVLTQNATVVKQAYADTAHALRLTLPTSQMALDAITSTRSTDSELSSALPQISALDSAAHGMAIEATAPLPANAPVFPSAAIGALGPLQDSAQIHAAQGSQVARHLGFAYVYRTTIPMLLNTGDLPTSAESQTINALSLSLASTLVADSSALTDLPLTETFTDLNDDAHDAVERFGSWQGEYLAALSESDDTLATALIAEVDDIKRALLEELGESMISTRIDIDTQIVVLAGDLELFLDRLTQS